MGLSWSRIISHLCVSRSSARRLVDTFQKNAESQIECHLDSSTPDRNDTDTCDEKRNKREAVKRDVLDAEKSNDDSTDNEVPAKMPKTFQILSDSLRQMRETQPENTG